MIDIKFRAYLKKSKEIVSVSSIHLKTQKIIFGFSKSKTNYGNVSVKFTDIELMQYTGLKDKNGKEIYEGDIIRLKTKSGLFAGEVEYCDSHGRYIVINRKLERLKNSYALGHFS